MSNTVARRNFLKAAGSLCGGLASAPAGALAMRLAGMAAMAAQSSQVLAQQADYKATVCVFLHGGSDSHNWVVPTDNAGYAAYAQARQELAWPMDRLLPISTAGQAPGLSLGMPEELAPLRRWYAAGQAAIIANVGPLLRPTSRAEAIAGVAVPAKLFSHNDQASTWQSLSPEGARSGWGGRMGDVLMSANAHPVFTAMSTSGNAVFLTGTNVTQFQVAEAGPSKVDSVADAALFGSTSGAAALRRTLARTSGDPLRNEYVRVAQRGLGAIDTLHSALSSTAVPLIPSLPIVLGNGSTMTLNKDSLARQLRLVAQLMAAGRNLGMRRQVFMVSMPGFDTHANQMSDQPSQMARVANAIDYFMQSMGTMGLLNNVTVFTASEFGRTLLSNGSGCDHGWGSHHFVAGGAVHGAAVYGRFPVVGLGSPDEIGSGRLLPSTAVVQLAETIARWMGVSDANLAAVLPGIADFDSRALNFL